jgi:hypothetical protein
MRITWHRKFLIGVTIPFLFIFMSGTKTLALTEVKLLSSDGTVEDDFGISVSISGDVALVGARGDDDKGSRSGSAYVFRWNGSNWVQEQKLLASDGTEGDVFGVSVSISGDVALVGAEGDDDKGTDSGSAYVFRWNGSNWVEEQKLLASDGAADDDFGSNVSISGDVALVGVPDEEKIVPGSGKAYVFRWNGSNWVQEQKLLASDGAVEDQFGVSVSISGDVALVGARGDDDKGSRSGSAYVFRWNGSNWVEEQKLLASDGAADDQFGVEVSISEDVALVGADEEEKIAPNPGSAYVFRWNGSNWVEEQKLLASDGAAGDGFGDSVSISGDVALVGVPDEEKIVPGSGKAYVFRWNGSNWVQEQKLLASDGDEGDVFGKSVSISGDVALVGATGDDDKGSRSGSVYAYDIELQKAMPWIPLLLLND